MTKLNEIYKCNVCGNMTEVIHAGAGELVCCSQPMQALHENTEDASQEKHVPVIEKTDKGVKVLVGEIPHPMEDVHFIGWIEILANERSYRKYLHPGDAPEAEFEVTAESIVAREYCNLHGLWKNEI